MDLRTGILGTAQRLGMDPVDLATIISYETAGTFDPTKRGPTTQWGQHRGLIQFGEPQAKQYGVNWDDPLGSQLGPGGAVERYFLQNGWKPGMGRLDAYSIVNAGGPGLYNRSDANNGGAPGTVADKVRSQMAGHEAKARALLGGDIADDTMKALGRQPMAQQTMQTSTKSGPMGLLGSVQPDEPGGLLGLLGQKPKWASKANDIGAVLLALSGSPAAAPLLEMTRDRKKDKREAERINQTVQWLAANGRTDLAEAVAAGTLGGSDAAKILLTPADPMAPLQLQAAELGLQKTQLEIDALKNPQPGYRILTPDEVKAQGLPAGGAYQVGPDGKISQVGGGGVNVTVGGGTPDPGKLSTDYAYILDPETRLPVIDPATGLPKSAPIPGSPAARELEDAATRRGKSQQQTGNSATIVMQDIDKAIGQVGGLTAGAGGALLSNVPGTGAKDLESTLTTIKANIGFDRLQQMREASPTGGALGAIAVQELIALQSVLGSLEQSQSPEQLRENLQRLKAIYEPIVAKAAAYPNASDFGFTQGGQSTPGRLRFNPETGDFE